MKSFFVAILTGLVSGPAAQLVCYILRTRPGSATSIIVAGLIGIAVGIIVWRAIDRPAIGGEDH